MKLGAVLPRSAIGTARLSLLLLTVYLAVLRSSFVASAPDLDTDAYGHHIIARKILESPWDLGVHWVWLPLFHYAQALAIAAFGVGLDAVRMVNVVLVFAIPWVVFECHRAARSARSSGDDLFVSWLTAVLTALSPIAMQMGTTGQPEPLFAFVSLLVVAAFAAGRLTSCACLLAVVVLVRYEGWALWLGVAGWLVVERLLAWRGLGAWLSPSEPASLEASSPPLPRWSFGSWLVIGLPLAVIVGWAAARRPFDPSWFWFLRGTREFANEALGVRSSLDRGVGQLLRDLRYYPIDVAWICFGYPLVLVPFGVVRLVRREGLRVVMPPLAVLAFITYVWIQRGSLGLFRHFMVLVPWYALAAAHGIVQLASWSGSVAKRADVGVVPRRAFEVAVIAGLAAAAFQGTWLHSRSWMDDWFRKGREAFSDRRELAEFLRTLPADARIACDEPTLEILSALDRRRFDRQPIDDSAATAARLHADAERMGQLWVATWSAKVVRLRSEGEVVFPPPGRPPAPDQGPTLTVLRLTGRGGQAAAAGKMR